MIYPARTQPQSLLGRLLPSRPRSEARLETINTLQPDIETPQNLECEALHHLDCEALQHTECEALQQSDCEALQHDAELAQEIITRIEARLPGRIRDLMVITTQNAVVLSGHCCTFYTKQLAQHAAMGVLEYEQLINNIQVRVTK